MFLLSLKEHKDEGAFAVEDSSGDKVLFLFEQEDDAERKTVRREKLRKKKATQKGSCRKGRTFNQSTLCHS